ncbi:hypothetical protein [Streptomyces sp. CB03911]|uniref:hypothetical protein n=1 Tax=Streptomycetaceae TaxID=2062 RepID=UPI00093E004B|nr:hypothetical protein [Streptomyces sp. CB03911]OKI14020.1 hypothetical protein A6A07_12565 [Streptomyces sp. CB03911]
MPFEDEFPLALRSAAELAPDPGAVGLAAGAVRRARRRRTRGALAGTAAALAVAALGALLLPGAGAGAAPGPSGGQVASRGVSGAEMVGLLKALLPPGRISEAGADTGARPVVHLLFDDGRGAATITLFVERVSGPDAARCLDSFDTPTESCERTVRPDGSVVVIDKMNGRSADLPKEWRAVYATPGGKQVLLTSYNGVNAGPPTTRPEPPLSAEQLTAVVTSPSWDAVFAGLPAPSASGGSPLPSPGAASAPAPAGILATVAPLLPPGSVIGEPQTQESAGRAHLRVTFEGRTSLLLVSVDPASAENRAAKDVFERNPAVTRRPDGSAVDVQVGGASGSADGPALNWSVEVFHPDGRRIRVGEWNGENGYDFRPGTPALTVEQLTAIAADPAWRS